MGTDGATPALCNDLHIDCGYDLDEKLNHSDSKKH